MGGETIAVEAVRIGDARYLTHPVLQQWIPYHEGLINGNDRTMEALFISPMDTLLDVLSQSGRFESRAVETVDGVNIEHYVWSTEFEEYPQKDTRRTVEIFIGTEDSLVRSLIVRDAWTHDWCDPSETCPDVLNEPGSDTYVLKFSFPGNATPVAAPSMDRDIVSSPVGPMALFTSPQIPFSIRYPVEWKPLWPSFPTWQRIGFQNYEDPERTFGIHTRFVDDTRVDSHYHATCSEEVTSEVRIEEEEAQWCAASKQSYAHMAAGEFNAAHESTYQVAEAQLFGDKNPNTPLRHQNLVSGDGWSAEVVEWIEPFHRGGTGDLHVRRLAHVQKVPTDRPECTDEATHCYVVTNFTYWGDAEHAESTRALADYSFGTLEWNGMSLDEG